MSHLAGNAAQTHQDHEHDWQAAEELAAAFDRLSKDDPEIRINGTRANDRTVHLSLGAGPSHPESTRQFCSHAIDATTLFDRDGAGDPVHRWLSLVWNNAPEQITGDPLARTIQDGAGTSAIVVRRLRGVPAARAIAEQQVRDAADRVRDLLSLLTWAFTLSEAGWRHSPRPAGHDVERLCPEGRAIHDWLLREIGTRTGLSRADLDVARATRRGSAADELGQLHRDDPSHLGWLIDGVHERFPGAVEYLHLKPGTSESAVEPEPDRPLLVIDNAGGSDVKPEIPERFTPTPADRNILQALAESSTTLIQVEIEQASGEPIGMVKERLPVLERARLVNRPHGDRKGYAITNAGRDLLAEPPVR